MPPLFLRHEPALVTLLADVEQTAESLRPLPVGSPGAVTERSKSGNAYWYRQFYDAAGHKRDEYLGPVGDPAGDARQAETLDWIAAARALGGSVRVLRRAGFPAVDGRTAATLAGLANAGIFAAGAVLVGSHAFGVLCGALGLRVAQYKTEDVDVARPYRLQVSADVSTLGLAALLARTGIAFVEVPSMDPRQPAVSLKPPGADRLRVDLLMPGKTYGIAPVAELGFSAQTLPQLDFLIAQPQRGVVLGPDLAIPVLVPSPERFVWHKVWTSIQSDRTPAEVDKDMAQARVLLAALAERDSSALEAALREMPRREQKRILDRLRLDLPSFAVHREARAWLADLCGETP